MTNETTFRGVRFFADEAAASYGRHLFNQISNMKTRIKKTAAVVPTPQTLPQMAALVGRIAELKLQEATEQLAMDKEIADIKEEHGNALSAIAEEIKPLLAAAEQWATSNPTEFGKNKSLAFLHGKIGWRTGTPKLEPLNKKWNWKSITEAVQRYLPAFIRSKPEVDKEAIIGQRDEEALKAVLPLCGLKVVQDEGFFVDVDLTQVETRETKDAK